MLEFLFAYKKYPYKVPTRVKFFNFLRYFFKYRPLEQILIKKILSGKTWWRKLIPPIYFYKRGSIRYAKRNDVNYALDLSCLVDHSIFFCEPNDAGVESLFKMLPSDAVIMDIGANIGFFTLNFARVCTKGFVYAFEPDQETFKSLQVNIRQNPFGNIRTHAIALGVTPDKMFLHKMETNNPGANRILPKGSTVAHEMQAVEVKTLDECIASFGVTRVDLLKIDVEGFEMFVLQGAKETIKKWNPVLFVELSEVNLRQQGFSAKDLVECIEEMNYEVKDARTMSPVNKIKTDYHTDILCFYKSTSI